MVSLFYLLRKCLMKRHKENVRERGVNRERKNSNGSNYLIWHHINLSLVILRQQVSPSILLQIRNWRLE